MTSARENPVFVALGGMIALTVAMGIGRFVYTPILPYMVGELGLSKSDAGLIASANYLGYLVGALLAASSRLPGSSRSWFMAALGVSALSTLVMAIPDGLTTFLILRFVGGVASAFVLVFSSVLILEGLALAGRPALSALHFSGVGVGIVVSAILVSSLAAYGGTWRELWLASGVTSIALSVVALWLLPGERSSAEPAAPAPQSRASPKLKYFIIAYGFFGFGYVITATFISDLVRNSADLQPLEPYIWLVVGLGAIPSVWAWSIVARRWSTELSFTAACIIEAVAVALSVISDAPALIVVSALLLGATFVAISALGLMHARQLSGGDARRMLALMTASFGAGQMVGPSFAGIIFDLSGSYIVPTLIAAGALFLAAALAIRTRF